MERVWSWIHTADAVMPPPSEQEIEVIALNAHPSLSSLSAQSSLLLVLRDLFYLHYAPLAIQAAAQFVILDCTRCFAPLASSLRLYPFSFFFNLFFSPFLQVFFTSCQNHTLCTRVPKLVNYGAVLERV